MRVSGVVLVLGVAVLALACSRAPVAQALASAFPGGPRAAGLPASTEAKGMQRRILSASGYDVTPLTQQEIAKLAQDLTPDQRRVLLHAGTEAPFCGGELSHKEPGTYVSALGGLPLFRSGDKFDSGTGWPSFMRPFDPAHIIERRDSSGGMVRVEILDARSGGHLGHVFDDGPRPTGRRYCLNAAALLFIADGTPLPPESRPVRRETAYFAGGCFWGIEDLMQRTPGVLEAISGYMGGQTRTPSYKQVCTGDTGHAETVQVEFDANRVSYHDLLLRLLGHIDPTTADRQGPDVGTQYRSAIFATSLEQRREAEAYLKALQASPRFGGRTIVTTVQDAATFWPAEDYHQDYHEKHGGSCDM